MKIQQKKKLKAFTLIELVIVIAILAILIAIAIPKFQQSNLKAQATAHNANVRAIKNAAILYMSDNPESQPVDVGDLDNYLDKTESIKPAKSLGDNFTIQLNNGNILVVPGMVKVEDNKLVEVSDNEGAQQ